MSAKGRSRARTSPEAPSAEGSPVPIFDAHLHIVDPAYPLVANDGYLPLPYTCEMYQAQAAKLGIEGGAVVSGSFQAFDQSYLAAALAKLGPGYVGVTQLSANVTDAELERLHAQGVRAVRFNLKRGGSEGAAHIEGFAQRLHEVVGWHVELYVDARELPPLVPVLTRLPAVSIDHLGLSKEGLPHVVRLAEHGVRVKATGFGRVDFDVADALRQIDAANPQALMFGTDLPSTRAPRPFTPADIDLVVDSLGEVAAHRVLWQNARDFYTMAVRS